MPSIDDIIVCRKTEGSFFNVYEDVQIIGERIFQSFKNKYIEDQGYPLSDNDTRVGILSNAMALSTLLEIEDMGVSISDFDKEFKLILKRVFSSLYGENRIYGNKITFSPDPYIPETEADKSITTYVETASKILIIMIDLRNYAVKNKVLGTSFGSELVFGRNRIDSFAELIALTEETLLGSLSFLSKAALQFNEEKTRKIDGKSIERNGLPKEISYRGWTFCDPEGEDDSFDTSIYYTYHGTNAYVSLYNAYPDIINNIISSKNSSQKGVENSALSGDELEIYKCNEEFIRKNWKDIDKLRKITNSSGRYVEMMLARKGVDLSFDFVRNDFSGISSADVISTQDSNAVINTLFILAIYLNSGIDEDYEWAGESQIDSFFNQLQFSISNIRKLYSLLKSDKKQELVDSYSLYSALLSEKYSSKYKDFIQRFRNGCRNVAIYDLIPLMCNTYSLIFDYLIRYPQLEMVNNLELIMENRSNDVDWLWGDSNGFNVNNHLYYVVALENFYRYYDEYEAPLSGNAKQYEEIVAKKEAEFTKRIDEEKKRFDDLQQRYNDLEIKFNNKKSALDEEVERISKNYFDSVFEERINKYIEESLSVAMDFYIYVDTERLTDSEIEERLKEDVKLRNAFALLGTIDFSSDMLGDLKDIDKESKEYSNKKAIQVIKSISNNIKI
jgi:hypothetical protein